MIHYRRKKDCFRIGKHSDRAEKSRQENAVKYAIELYFDKETEKKLYHYAKRIAEEKISTKFLEWKTRPSIPKEPKDAPPPRKRQRQKILCILLHLRRGF